MSAASTPFLRPMHLAELLDQAIQLYRRNFLKFIGILAIPYIPLLIVQTGLSYWNSSSLAGSFRSPSAAPTVFAPSFWFSLLGTYLLLFLQIILIQGIANAALARAVADDYTGQPVGILDSYRKLGSAWLRLIVAIVLLVAVMVVLWIWLFIPCIGWFTGPGLLLFTWMVVLPFVAPIIVLEKRGILTALRRAWDLGRSRFWWLIGFVLILVLFSQLVVTGPVFLLNLILRTAMGNQTNFQEQLVLGSVVQLLVSLLTGMLYLPLQLTAMTVVYFDLRVRSEGLDLALQSASASNPEASIVSVAETSPEPQGSFLAGRDVGYFALLSLMGIALCTILYSVLFGLALLIMSLSGIP